MGEDVTYMTLSPIRQDFVQHRWKTYTGVFLYCDTDKSWCIYNFTSWSAWSKTSILEIKNINDLLAITALETGFSEMLIGIDTFPFTKM